MSLGMLLILGTGFAFAGGKAEDEVPAGPAAQEEDTNEAPMLAEMVKTGELPPLEERLPEVPLVIEPTEEIGTYGGTLYKATAAFYDWLTHNLTREGLTRWPMPMGNGAPMPALATEWEYNEDGTEVTVHLRKGVKWSDGMPLTSEDFDFYWNDICRNPEVIVEIPSSTLLEGQAPVLDVVDAYTIKFIYHKPYRYFPEAFASTWEIAWPKHFMKQYHPKYNSEATYQNLNDNIRWEQGRGSVTLQAWMLDEYIAGEGYTMVRNPYYWKVDPEGNQYPYFDRVRVDLVEERRAVAVGNATGKYDFDAMWVGTQHLELFESQREKGDFTIGHSRNVGMSFRINMDVEDDTKRAAFRDVNFRRAFSMAIDRDEINEVLFYGLMDPMAAVFHPESQYYVEETATMYVEHDPTRAQQMLESAGYRDTNGDGFRELNGERLEVVINVAADHDLYSPAVEMIVEDLEEVGIKAIQNSLDQDTHFYKYAQGDFEVYTFDLDGAQAPLAFLHYWAATGPNTPAWHMNWENDPISENWLQANEWLRQAAGMEPEIRVERLKQVSRWYGEQVWKIGLGAYRRPCIISNRLGNRPPDNMINRNAQLTSEPPFQAFQLFAKAPRPVDR